MLILSKCLNLTETKNKKQWPADSVDYGLGQLYKMLSGCIVFYRASRGYLARIVFSYGIIMLQKLLFE